MHLHHRSRTGPTLGTTLAVALAVGALAPATATAQVTTGPVAETIAFDADPVVARAAVAAMERRRQHRPSDRPTDRAPRDGERQVFEVGEAARVTLVVGRKSLKVAKVATADGWVAFRPGRDGASHDASTSDRPERDGRDTVRIGFLHRRSCHKILWTAVLTDDGVRTHAERSVDDRCRDRHADQADHRRDDERPAADPADRPGTDDTDNDATDEGHDGAGTDEGDETRDGRDGRTRDRARN